MKSKTPDKTLSLYNGEVVIDFYEGKHWYIKRGEEKTLTSVTGATGILQNAGILMEWATKMMQNHLIDLIQDGKPITSDAVFEARKQFRIKRDTGADIGTQVHEWIEKYIKRRLTGGENPSLPDNEKVRNGIIAFKGWVDENKVRFVASEKIVYSKKHNYVGTLDCIAEVNGKMTLVDFKTGNYLSETAPWQVSAYLEADKEESGWEYKNRIILKIVKEDIFANEKYGTIAKSAGEFEVYDLGMKDHRKDFKAFLGCLAVKNRTKERKGGVKK